MIPFDSETVRFDRDPLLMSGDRGVALIISLLRCVCIWICVLIIFFRHLSFFSFFFSFFVVLVAVLVCLSALFFLSLNLKRHRNNNQEGRRVLFSLVHFCFSYLTDESLRIYVRGDRKCVMTTAIVPVVYRLVKYIAMLCSVYTVCSTVAESRETVPRRSIDRRRAPRIFRMRRGDESYIIYKINQNQHGYRLWFAGQGTNSVNSLSFHAEREFRCVRTREHAASLVQRRSR